VNIVFVRGMNAVLQLTTETNLFVLTVKALHRVQFAGQGIVDRVSQASTRSGCNRNQRLSAAMNSAASAEQKKCIGYSQPSAGTARRLMFSPIDSSV
jgi:hypothetical protein